MREETATVIMIGLGLLVSLTVITFLLTRATRANTFVSFTRDSEGRIIDIVERSL